MGLGFGDLVSFNKALLAKQIWRLLQNPTSLAARIIRAKYYPSKTVLEAKLGNRPSFALRSINGSPVDPQAGAYLEGGEWTGY